MSAKDSYVVYGCGFVQNGKWEWFYESKWRCKNDVGTLLADGITSTNNPLLFTCTLHNFFVHFNGDFELNCWQYWKVTV